MISSARVRANLICRRTVFPPVSFYQPMVDYKCLIQRGFVTQKDGTNKRTEEKGIENKDEKDLESKDLFQNSDNFVIHPVKPKKSTKNNTVIEPVLSQPISTSPSYSEMDPKSQIEFLKKQLEQSNLFSSSDTISINNEELYDPQIHLPDKPDFMDRSLNYEEATPLSDQLVKLIGLRGPITTAAFMTIALTDPSNGYYTSKINSTNDDDLFDDNHEESTLEPSSSAIIGKHGDFTTAPEISQIFGECMLLFYIYQYRNLLNSPKAIQIVEIGPGKGTLIADIISTACASFPDFADALAEGGGVHLVEVSPDMRKKQRDSLLKLNQKLGAYRLALPDKEHEYKDAESNMNETSSKEKKFKTIRVHWHDALTFVPPADIHGNNIPHFILCQEFLDALPIHSFQKHTDGSWRERMVDVDVIPNASGDSTSSVDSDIMLKALPHQDKKPRLRFVLSKDKTSALNALLKLSPEQEKNFEVGHVIEVCPMGLMLVQDISERISQCKGACLLIDYGTTFGNGDTLRGFLKHKQVHPLTMPGRVDVTADVVFGSLRQETEKTNGVTCHGPTTQGEFLSSMGAVERVLALIDKDETSDEEAEELYVGLERLVSFEEMGERYKILGIVSGERRETPGF